MNDNIEAQGNLSAAVDTTREPVESPQSPAEWTSGLREDLRSNETLKRFTTSPDGLSELARGYITHEKLIGSGRFVRPLDEGASPEEVAQFESKLRALRGIPESREGYELAYQREPLPEMDASFRAMALQEGLTPQQAQSIVMFGEQLQERAEAVLNARKEEAENLLKEEWGPDYESRRAGVNAGITHIFGEDAKDILEDTGLAKFALRVAEAFPDDFFVSDDWKGIASRRSAAPTMTPEQARAEIARLQSVYSDVTRPLSERQKADHEARELWKSLVGDEEVKGTGRAGGR